MNGVDFTLQSWKKKVLRRPAHGGVIGQGLDKGLFPHAAPTQPPKEGVFKLIAQPKILQTGYFGVIWFLPATRRGQPERGLALFFVGRSSSPVGPRLIRSVFFFFRRALAVT